MKNASFQRLDVLSSWPKVDFLFSRVARLGLLCALSICMGLTGNLAQASGCRYSHSSQSQLFQAGSQSRFARFFLWSSGSVQRIYEDGRFVYYQVPTEPPPCDGPSCRPAEPGTSFQSATTVESQRLTVDAKRTAATPIPPAASRPLCSVEQQCAPSHVLDGPLRPPCTPG